MRYGKCRICKLGGYLNTSNSSRVYGKGSDGSAEHSTHTHPQQTALTALTANVQTSPVQNRVFLSGYFLSLISITESKKKEMTPSSFLLITPKRTGQCCGVTAGYLLSDCQKTKTWSEWNSNFLSLVKRPSQISKMFTFLRSGEIGSYRSAIPKIIT